MENEEELRAKIVSEARSWLLTPYISNGMVKGRRGGTDCAMFLVGVYRNVGLIPKEFDPRPYPPQWHVHRNEEKYLGYVTQFAKEVAGPPERMPKPGDFVMFKIGLAFAHGAIILAWPLVIHAIGNAAVVEEDVSKNTTGKRAPWQICSTGSQRLFPSLRDFRSTHRFRCCRLQLSTARLVCSRI
jgi:cell wall-associated NlpC family hydrolase